MSSMHPSHDVYTEVSSRRHREAEDWSRARALQRDAHSARAKLPFVPSSRRARLVTVLSPMVAIAALVVAGVIG